MQPKHPLITVGIVALNRDWIIDKMLTSLQNQTYPHNKIFVLLVDGESQDNTVKIAKRILYKASFNGHQIIIKKSNIPEARNICIRNMKGNFLFFWDSDIIMGPNALENMVTRALETGTEILTTKTAFIYTNTTEEAIKEINQALLSQTNTIKKPLKEVTATAMGSTLLTKKVLDNIQFDPDLASLEDYDFSAKARKNNIKIFANKAVQAFDINLWTQWYSDIHIDMPLKTALKGLKKKAEVNVLACGPKMTFSKATRFFLTNKRYLFYLGYIPSLLITAYGLLANNYGSFMFPIYLVFFMIWQTKKRGIKRGVNATIKSIVVGLPFSLLLIFYFTEHALKKQS
jgi:glycosyltransferase involved in cell wall biosynthesis